MWIAEAGGRYLILLQILFFLIIIINYDYNQNRSIRVDCRGRGRRYYQQWGAAHQGSVDHTHSYHCTHHPMW